MITTPTLLEAIANQPRDPGDRATIPRIENAAGARASIYLLDAVSKWTAANAKDFQAALAGITAPNIDLYINCPGGSVFEGVAIYNFLKSHPAKITVHVVGLAASIASVIAMAGDEINMADGALMMIHSPSLATGGNATQLRKDAALLDQIEEAILDIYVGKTARNRVEIKALLQAETWLSADQAVSAKFASKKTAAVKAAAEWKATDFPALPTNAKAFAAQLTPPPKMTATTTKPPAATTKPDFSNLFGLDRVRASMKWDADQKAATTQAQEKAAPVVAPKATTGATAAEIAAEIIAQQKAEASKPTGLAKVSAFFKAQNASSK